MNIQEAKEAIESGNIIRVEAIETEEIGGNSIFYIWLVPGTNLDMEPNDRFIRNSKGRIQYWRSLDGVFRAIEKIGAPDFWVRRV